MSVDKYLLFFFLSPNQSCLFRTARLQASHIDAIPMHDAKQKVKSPWECRTTLAAKDAKSLESLYCKAIAIIADDMRRCLTCISVNHRSSSTLLRSKPSGVSRVSPTTYLFSCSEKKESKKKKLTKQERRKPNFVIYLMALSCHMD